MLSPVGDCTAPTEFSDTGGRRWFRGVREGERGRARSAGPGATSALEACRGIGLVHNRVLDAAETLDLDVDDMRVQRFEVRV